MTRTRITSRPQSLKLVTGGVIRPKETHRLPAPVTVSDGDPSRPWMGKRLDPQAYAWDADTVKHIGVSMAHTESITGRTERRQGSGLGNILAAIFLGTCALYFAAQAVRWTIGF